MIVVQTAEDAVNIALARIGHPRRVGSLYDGSEAAKVALDVYGQTRDELLRAEDWDFAERSTNLALLKSAPQGGYGPWQPWSPATNPPPGWLFEYSYPSDCLKVRSVQEQPIFAVDYDPQPFVFHVVNDQNYSPPRQVILCNAVNAILTYTGQITDPTTWNSMFVEALVASLATRLQPRLMASDQVRLEGAKLAAGNEQLEVGMANNSQG